MFIYIFTCAKLMPYLEQNYGISLINGGISLFFSYFCGDMDYINVSFTLSANDSLTQVARDLLADRLGQVGFHSFEDTTEGINGYIPRDQFSVEVVENVIDAFPLIGVAIAYECEVIPDKDWNKEWEAQGFAPIDVDGKMLIYDARGTSPTLTRPIEIGIRARQAFGTGTHETTRLMLSRMLTMEMKDKRVLDCGCGTGILSLAAMKLGAREVVAYDIDPWSVENTRENATLNGVGNVEVLEGDVSVLKQVRGTMDLVVANINRNILLSDLPSFYGVLAPSGSILMSGFFTEDIPLLMEKASGLGLKKIAQSEENHWAMLHFER